MPWQLALATAVIFTFSVVHYTTILTWSALAWRRTSRSDNAIDTIAMAELTESPERFAVSVIMPAHNEGVGIVTAVRSMLGQAYPHLEIVVVNDGSTDDTLDVLTAVFDLEADVTVDAARPIATDPIHTVHRSRIDRRLIVVDKVGGGSKAGACNAGLNAAHNPWVVVMDGDEIAEPDAVARCMAAVAASEEPVVAVGASLLPTNDCTFDDGGRVVDTRISSNYWVGCQTAEYLLAFFVARPGIDAVGGLPFVSGGFGLFQRDALLEIDGYTVGHMGEDLEICVRLQRHQLEHDRLHRVMHVPEAIVWTEFPSDRRVLGRQRRRWQAGLASVMALHAGVSTRREYGRFGRVGIGSLRVLEWWGGGIEALAWVVIALIALGGWIHYTAMVLLLCVAQALSFFTLCVAVAIVGRRTRAFSSGRDIVMLLFWGFVSSFGFRQLVLWWRVRGTISRTSEWGQMTRTGVAQVVTATS